MRHELAGGRHQQAGLYFHRCQAEAGDLLHGVGQVGEHQCHARTRPRCAQEPRQLAVAHHRGLHHLLGCTVQPGDQHALVGTGLHAVQCVAHALVGQQPAHVNHRALHVREQQHLVHVLGQCAQIQQQGLVVFHPALGEPAGAGRENVGHRLVLTLGQFAQLGVFHQSAVGLGRRVAATVGSERGVEAVGRNLCEVAPEHLAVRFLRQWLGFFQQIPHTLGEVVMHLAQLAGVVHARDERIPLGRVQRAVGVLCRPAPAQQQLALVAIVSSVDDGVQQFSGAAVAGVAERVAQLWRVDGTAWHGRADGFHQLGELLAVCRARCAVAVGCVLHRLEYQTQERTAELAVQALGPLLDAGQDGLGELQLDACLLAGRDRAALAGDRQRDAHGVHARDQFVGCVLDVQQVAVHFHLAAALGQVPHGLQFVVQAAQFLHGHLGQRLGVVHSTLHAGLQRAVHGGVVLGDQFHVLQRTLLQARGHVVGRQDGAHGVDHIGIAALVHQLLVAVLRDLAEELHDLLGFGLRFVQRLHRGVVQHLVALGCHRSLGVGLGRGLLPALASLGFSSPVLGGCALQVFHLAPCCQVGRELFGRLGQCVDGDLAAVAGRACLLAGVEHVGLRLELGGQ